LRIVHVTLHESVASAVRRITPELIVAATLAGVRACQALGVAAPRVGLMGLNPHASEGGLFGPEDAATTFVAARLLREAGLQVDDPQGADVLLACQQQIGRPHDLLVAMLHDQGHIPVKLLAPQGASAITVGADVLLATTGHGSAMDIAGQGVARPDALLRSLSLLAMPRVGMPGVVRGQGQPPA
jgi:4-hydroxythreonine-4-phosphate dehydrogenase/1,2-dihydroxy-3,5-cyclohexadiene-1,4-dicarboxylate dehydrogenase